MNAVIAYFMTVVSTVTDRFEDKSKGATAVEYGLMVALIAVAIIATVTLLGGGLNSLFTDVAAKLNGVVVP